MAKLFLITTPIIDTWDFDKNTLMLGNWCNTFEKRKYLWLDPNQETHL